MNYSTKHVANATHQLAAYHPHKMTVWDMFNMEVPQNRIRNQRNGHSRDPERCT